MRRVEAIEARKRRWQFHQVLSRQFKRSLVRMIGGAFGIGVACQVAFDMATEDVGDRTIRYKINHASSAPLICPCILEGQSAWDQKIA